MNGSFGHPPADYVQPAHSTTTAEGVRASQTQYPRSL